MGGIHIIFSLFPISMNKMLQRLALGAVMVLPASCTESPKQNTQKAGVAVLQAETRRDIQNLTWDMTGKDAHPNMASFAESAGY
jgi:hypothetical protein